MNKFRLLSIAVIVLVVINLILIVIMFSQKPSHSKRMGPRNIIIEKLNFDENQIQEYDNLIKWHRDEIAKSEHEMMQLKNKLYSNLTNTSNSNIKDSLLNELGKVQIKIEYTHYKHFEDIKKLCKADQEERFSKLTQEIAKLFSHPPIKGRP